MYFSFIGNTVKLTRNFNEIIKEDLILVAPNYTFNLKFLYSRENDGFSKAFRQENPRYSPTHDVYYKAIRVKEIKGYRHNDKNNKARLLREHNERTPYPNFYNLYHKGRMIERMDYLFPETYKEYTSALWNAIGGSVALSNLYSTALDGNTFNWCAASEGLRPSRILEEYFVINHQGWWDSIPYNSYRHETETLKIWFSVFDEYELSSIDFYYPTDTKKGDDIEILIHYRFNWAMGSPGRVCKVKWVQDANGLTVFCLLPHIYLFVIELAMLNLSFSFEKINKVRKYLYNRMLEATQNFRNQNVFVNF